jgi:hypothetical protein
MMTEQAVKMIDLSRQHFLVSVSALNGRQVHGDVPEVDG